MKLYRPSLVLKTALSLMLLSLICCLAAPDYLYLRRRFRWEWDRRPEFNVQNLTQVKSLQRGGPLTVRLRVCRKVIENVNKKAKK